MQAAATYASLVAVILSVLAVQKTLSTEAMTSFRLVAYYGQKSQPDVTVSQRSVSLIVTSAAVKLEYR